MHLKIILISKIISCTKIQKEQIIIIETLNWDLKIKLPINLQLCTK